MTERVVTLIRAIGMERMPNEACGLLLPDGAGGAFVIEVPNTSEEPGDSCTLSVTDMEEAVAEWIEYLAERGVDPPPHPAEVDVVAWHTHPGGNVGPSKADLRRRTYAVRCLVVPLPDGPATQY